MTDAPINRYSLVDPIDGSRIEGAASRAEDEPADDDLAGQVIRWLTLGILGVCLAIWAVVGAIFWIPLIVRSTLHFSFALIQSMLAGEGPQKAGAILRRSVDFYRRGFVVATEAVLGEAPRAGRGRTRSDVELGGGRMVREVLWVALVWYLLFWLVGIVDSSPADLVRGFFGLPWAALFASVVEGIQGVLDAIFGAAGDAPASGAEIPAAAGEVADTAGGG